MPTWRARVALDARVGLRAWRTLIVALGLGAGLLNAGLAHAQSGSTDVAPRGSSSSGSVVGRPLPKGSALQFPAITLIDGRVLPPEYWKGKVVVIERWATWCPFCARQNPNLNGLYLDHRAKGLEVLALSTDKSVQTVQAYMAKSAYKFHVAMMTPELLSRLGSTRTLPEVWVIGRDGLLKDYIPGEMFPEDVEELAKWLAQ